MTAAERKAFEAMTERARDFARLYVAGILNQMGDAPRRSLLSDPAWTRATDTWDPDDMELLTAAWVSVLADVAETVTGWVTP